MNPTCHMCRSTDLKLDDSGLYYRCRSCWSVVLKEDAGD